MSASENTPATMPLAEALPAADDQQPPPTRRAQAAATRAGTETGPDGGHRSVRSGTAHAVAPAVARAGPSADPGDHPAGPALNDEGLGGPARNDEGLGGPARNDDGLAGLGGAPGTTGAAADTTAPVGPTATAGAVAVRDDLQDLRALTDPAEAFDRLYARVCRPLGQQAYLLCGDRDLSARAVAYAFRLAWEHWPEVAVDRDPAGWVRAAAYEYALSPWHRLRLRQLGGQTPAVVGGDPDQQRLLDAMLGLPPSFRRSVVLHDVLGLGLPETAAESEATTTATAARISRSREELAAQVPQLAQAEPAARGPLLGRLLVRLSARGEMSPVPASHVRSHSERSTARHVYSSLALVLALFFAVAVVITLH